MYVKRFSTFHWACSSLFSKKYCVACKKLTLKVQINLSFVTPFEDRHCILLFRYGDMAHKLYSGFDIQDAFMSTVVLINEESDVTGPVPIAVKK